MKNNHTYPVFLDLHGISCLVVGGGRIATRKVLSLVRAGARLTVVSPLVNARILKLAHKNKLVWKAEPYAKSCLCAMRMVIAATNDKKVNHQIFNDAEMLGIMANVVDDPDYCRFVLPARFTSGNLEIAVTTGGAAPVYSKIVRDDIANHVVAKYTPIISALGKNRLRIKNLSPGSKNVFWKKVASVDNTGKIGLKKVKTIINDTVKTAEGGNQ